MRSSVALAVTCGVLAVGLSGFASAAIGARDENPRFIVENAVTPPPPTVTVPEPGTLTLLGLGALAVGLRNRRR